MGKPAWKWVVLILSCSLTVHLAAQDSSRNEIQKHYALATEARQAGHNDIAIKEFREILQLDSHNAEAHANIGVIEYTEKHYAQAAEEFRDALKLRPSLWNAEAFLGMSEFHLGHPQEARHTLRNRSNTSGMRDCGLKREVI